MSADPVMLETLAQRQRLPLATALVRLGRIDEAAPLIEELARRGVGRPSFVALARATGR